jgi:hypothetical protein
LNAALETIEVIANGHCQSKKFFKGLLRMGELDDDPARFEADAGRQILKLLAENLGRCFDQQARPLAALLFQLDQFVGDLLSAALFVVVAIALSQTAEVGDEGVPVGETVGADPLSDTGSQNLLGAAATNAQERFYSGAVDERAGKGFENLDYRWDSAVPEGFGGHGCLHMLVRTCAECKILER